MSQTKNRPIVSRRTNRGNISLAVFRNLRTNRQTGEQFTADSLSVSTGYRDQNGNWINSSISLDARLIPNLVLALTHLDADLAAVPTPVQGQPQTQAPQQPAPPVAMDDEVPF